MSRVPFQNLTSLIRPEANDLIGPLNIVFIKESLIHERGLFAGSNIRAGTRIIQYVGEEISKKESLKRCSANNQYIFALDSETDLDGRVGWNPARFINHHCQPNSEAQSLDGGIWIVATRNISSGEEITFNYGYDLISYRDHPCHCRAKSCIGYIVAEEFFPLLRKRHSVTNQLGTPFPDPRPNP